MKRVVLSSLRYAPLVVMGILHCMTSRIMLVQFHFVPLAVSYLVMGLCAVAGLLMHCKKPYPFVVLVSYMAILSIPYVLAYPVLSDDAYRYIWEGHVQNKGHNPYLTPPGSAVFAGDTLAAHVNFPQIPAVYPPLAQLVFRALASIAPSMFLFKAFFMLCALGILWLLAKKRDLFAHADYLWAILPITLVETAWSGHFDALGIFALALAVLALKRGNGVSTGLFLAMSISIKLMPVMFIPYFFCALPREKRVGFLCALLMVPILYLPFLSANSSLFFALVNYTRHWVNASAPYSLLISAGCSAQMARLILLGVFATTWILVFVKIKEINVKIYVSLFSLTLFSPVVWPWYLLWLIPFGAAYFPYTIALQTILSISSYAGMESYLTGGIWSENFGVCLAVFIITLGSAFFEYTRNKDRRHSRVNTSE